MKRNGYDKLLPVWLSVCTLPLGLAGCQPGAPAVSADDPQVAAFVRLMQPRRIEIQRSLTKPVSFDGTGNADGIEVILAARDVFGDPIKVVGNFQFELHRKRTTSSDRLGERIAHWTVEIDSQEGLALYWDHLARLCRFPLQLDRRILPPGDYILSARLRSPMGETLFDEYEFTLAPGTVPIVPG